MRRSGSVPKDGDILGQTLGAFLAAHGGVRDEGGELKAIGADEWHKGMPFQKRLVSDAGMSIDAAGGLAGQNTGHGQFGYFPELQGGRPEPRDVLDALGDEMRGKPRYLAPDADQQRLLDRRDMALQVEQALHERGIDVKTASNEEIKAALTGPELHQPMSPADYETMLAEQRSAEGLTAALRDPETGKIYEGKSHSNALNEAAKGDDALWRRLHDAWDARGKDVGYIDAKGKFITEAQAERRSSSAMRTYRQGGEPAVVLRGDELGAYSSPKEMRALAKAKLQEIRQAGPVHNPRLGEIKFSAQSVGKTLSNLTDQEAALIPALRDILEQGRLISSKPDYQGRRDVKAWHTLNTVVRVGGQERIARTTVREDVNGKFYYDLRDEGTPELRQEVGGGVPSNDLPENSVEKPPSSSGSDLTTDRLHEDLAGEGGKFNLSLEQPSVGPARGSITLGEGRTMIRLFRDANLSTFSHEMAHLYLKQMLGDALREAAPQALRDDVGTLRKYLGMGEDQAEPTREHHELFARSWEAYLMEGKAPSAELRMVFQKFSAWMTRRRWRPGQSIRPRGQKPP